jgi:hypothetical protein
MSEPLRELRLVQDSVFCEYVQLISKGVAFHSC